MERDFKCHSCSEAFNSLDKMNVHIEREHNWTTDRKKKKVQCNVCGSEVINQASLIIHTRMHTGERPFRCEVAGCGLAFKAEKTRNDHIKFKLSEERLFKCDFPGCLHTAKTSSTLYAHKQLQIDERPFACPSIGCSFSTKFKSNIIQHIKCVHSEAKSFACTNCDYKTALSSSLKRHMRRRSGTRDFKCNQPECTESFKSSSDLRRHFRNRHGERTVQCNHLGCEGKFANASALCTHKRNVHATKIHACPTGYCSYRCNRANTLARHMIVHDKINKKFSCSKEGCEYIGKSTEALKIHVRRHQTLLPCPESGCGRHAPTKEALEDHVKLHNNLGRPFKCPLCYKHFDTLQHLQTHCATHTNEKPFVCGQCRAGNKNSNYNWNSNEIGQSDEFELEFELVTQDFVYRNLNSN